MFVIFSDFSITNTSLDDVTDFNKEQLPVTIKVIFQGTIACNILSDFFNH